MADKYWRNDDMYYVGVPFVGAVELTEAEFLAHQEELRIKAIKDKRAKLIADVEWRIRRHDDEVALDMTPTEDVLPIRYYIQALRDITSQVGFPNTIVWPVLET